MQRRVDVVDDDEDVRSALERLLSSAGHAVRSFESATRWLDEFDAGIVSCLVLDLAMPEVDGLQLQQQLALRARDLPIVFLTGRGDIGASVQAMKRGAMDFLTKPIDETALLAAVDAALAEAQRRHERERRTGALALRLATLTRRERQVLDQVVLGRLNKQIAADLGATEKTIKFHRGNLMRKMGVRSVAELTRLVAAVEPIGDAQSQTKVQ